MSISFQCTLNCLQGHHSVHESLFLNNSIAWDFTTTDFCCLCLIKINLTLFLKRKMGRWRKRWGGRLQELLSLQKNGKIKHKLSESLLPQLWQIVKDSQQPSTCCIKKKGNSHTIGKICGIFSAFILTLFPRSVVVLEVTAHIPSVKLCSPVLVKQSRYYWQRFCLVVITSVEATS